MSDSNPQPEPRVRSRLEEKVPVSAPASSGETVTVCCKLPNGLILQLEEVFERNEPLQSGGYRTIPQYRRRPEQVVCRGYSVDFDKIKQGRSMPPVAGGFGMTFGVPKDFWEQWLAAHKDDSIVREGLIFAAGSELSARHEADNRQNLRSGLEPINPDEPGRFAADVRNVQVGTMTAE